METTLRQQSHQSGVRDTQLKTVGMAALPGVKPNTRGGGAEKRMWAFSEKRKVKGDIGEEIISQTRGRCKEKPFVAALKSRT